MNIDVKILEVIYILFSKIINAEEKLTITLRKVWRQSQTERERERERKRERRERWRWRKILITLSNSFGLSCVYVTVSPRRWDRKPQVYFQLV